MEVIFWVSLTGAIYSYVLYPLLLLVLPKRRVRTNCRTADLPRLSVIIAVYNEQARIATKLENTLRIDYPRERIEIIVASDCSSDGTDRIVGAYAPAGVRLVRSEVRRGKEFAQQLAIEQSVGDILIFSDVATKLMPDAFKKVAADFADGRVGAVSSEDRFVDQQGRVIGEGLYVRYEMFLRQLETKVRGIVGMSGSFFAARREVCCAWDWSIPSDFNVAINCESMGLVAVSDPEVEGYYENIRDAQGEYGRKLRTVIRGLTAVAKKKAVLNPIRYGFFAFQVWSHKVMRWAVPWFLLGLFVASWTLAGTRLTYALAAAGQTIVYTLVIIGGLSRRIREWAVVRIPYFFVEANLAVAHAAISFLRGRRVTRWEPSKR